MRLLAKYGAIFLLVITGASAQQLPPRERACWSTFQEVERKFREVERDDARREAEELQFERAYQQRLHSRMREFADAWNALAAELTERGAFNIKQCNEIAKAFQRLQKTRGWPRPEKK